MLRKSLFGLFGVCLLAGVGAGIFVFRAKSVKSEFVGEKLFHINEHENVFSVARRLENERLVVWQGYFLWSAWTGGLQGKIHAGDFVIPGKLTSPDVVSIFLANDGKPKEMTLTFPEGWDAKKMAARLSGNGFDGDGFLALVANPLPKWKEKYPTLASLPEGVSLEGFLFPDTYTFLLSATPENILAKMLQNFETRFTQDMRDETLRQGKSILDIVTMASIIEREIGTANQSTSDIARERGMVSDLFWRRLADGHALESDATVQYARGGEAKVQHSLDDIAVVSPYNTYVNKGLPPGPISNPGLVSLRAALFPIANDFYFFLNNPKTGQTFFSKTFEEHVKNKAANGL
ncbi:MAG: endolytic transglycosylase MltG [Candidatus Moraniibacteriota bacterium]